MEKQFHLSLDIKKPINHVVSADVQFKHRWIIEVKHCVGSGVQHVKHHLFLVQMDCLVSGEKAGTLTLRSVHCGSTQ